MQPSLLDVFVVPHTHADTGWMLTVEQYYEQLVRPILSTTLASLARDARARYCWAEIAFLARWWEEQPDTTRQSVRALVRNGQLELVEGGWSQADEIVASLRERVLNLEAGHDWIGAHIGTGRAWPRLGWKLDPFGGSSLSAAIFAAQRADAMVKMRVPSWMKASFQSAGQSEFLWRPPRELGGSGDALFLNIIMSYSALAGAGFDFDQYRTKSPAVTTANVHARANAFAGMARAWAPFFARSGANMLMLPWGGDFRWQNGSLWYGNFSRLAAHINANPATFGMRVRLATPSEYFVALHEVVNVTFPINEQVWQPYDGQPFRAASHPNEYMTGIFTSRTEEKRLTRRAATRAVAAGSLRVAAELQCGAARRPSDAAGRLLALAKQAVGIGAHHDALPGTSNSGTYVGTDPIRGGFAVEDYKRRLAEGVRLADEAASDAVAALVGADDARLTPLTRSSVLALPARIVLANPGSRPLATTVRQPVTVAAGSRVGACVYHDAVDDPSSPITSQLTRLLDPARWELAFLAEVPPLSARTYRIVAGDDGRGNCSAVVWPTSPAFVPDDGRAATNGSFTLQGGCLAASFGHEGELLSITRDGVRSAASPSFVAYRHANKSGSYFFVPSGPATPATSSPAARAVHVWRGPVYSQVSSTGSDGLGLTATIRTQAADALACSIGLQATVSTPLPNSTELALRFASAIVNRGGAVATHNSLALERWTANASAGIGGNYHAAVSHAVIADSHSSLLLAFDRTHGVASLAEGELEVMLQRNVGGDGEGPACNDTAPVIAPMEVLVGVGEGKGGAALDEVEHTRIVSAAFDDALVPYEWSAAPQGTGATFDDRRRGGGGSFSRGLVDASALPASVRVLSWGVAPAPSTLAADGSARAEHRAAGAVPRSCAGACDRRILLRLVNDGNVPARLSLAAFLQPAGVTVGDVTDMTLSGHQQAADVVPMRWPAHNATSGEDYAREEDEERYSRASGTQLMLRPRRLRTVRFCAGRVH